jgi:hypothetical protein
MATLSSEVLQDDMAVALARVMGTANKRALSSSKPWSGQVTGWQLNSLTQPLPVPPQIRHLDFFFATQICLSYLGRVPRLRRRQGWVGWFWGRCPTEGRAEGVFLSTSLLFGPIVTQTPKSATCENYSSPYCDCETVTDNYARRHDIVLVEV